MYTKFSIPPLSVSPSHSLSLSPGQSLTCTNLSPYRMAMEKTDEMQRLQKSIKAVEDDIEAVLVEINNADQEINKLKAKIAHSRLRLCSQD